MTVTTATSVGGFAILPLRYSSTATHNLYVRAHAGTRPAGLPEGRTLFVVNVPPDATERELSALFATYGTVERVAIASSDAAPNDDDDDDEEQEQEEEAPAPSSSSEDEEAGARPRKKRRLDQGKDKKEKEKPAGPPKVVPLPASPARELHAAGSSAHLVFLDASSLQRALSSIPPSKPPTWPPKSSSANAEPSGLAHYAARHAACRPPLAAVLEHAESAILHFDWQQETAKRVQKSKYRKGEEIVDEDGFTLVVRGGAYGQSVGGGVGVASKKFELGAGDDGKKRKKKEKKEKDGFYAFQVREKNLKEHAELRKKFEEDKKKVEELQKKRAFVPY
ncbi:hypothetical protein AURDEDRAFT_116977 [Auricularia subglabra TFB-10046 SS5]|uniref:RRM domain-containing protein n=1 Tax=Auricularia subglabra (strain TFB-10046 / SS5) TaxID=717982 RepID=J0DA21_AURST|nr:hypothetical protein AURDEDRAFT_116977 [Auricularia subglabra TFB-10046 SS5]